MAAINNRKGRQHSYRHTTAPEQQQQQQSRAEQSRTFLSCSAAAGTTEQDRSPVFVSSTSSTSIYSQKRPSSHKNSTINIHSCLAVCGG